MATPHFVTARIVPLACPHPPGYRTRLDSRMPLVGLSSWEIDVPVSALGLDAWPSRAGRLIRNHLVKPNSQMGNTGLQQT